MDTALLEQNGYQALTHEYVFPEEQEMFERAKAQLDKNSRAYVIVPTEQGAVIWTKQRLCFTDKCGEGA
jgi:hypothetical protein